MTDEQIIKALECCSDDSVIRCEECPYCETEFICRKKDMLCDSFDLIKRQKAEIERLKINLKAVLDERADHSEAIKEFARRVEMDIPLPLPHRRKIDNLVKEMVGDTE